MTAWLSRAKLNRDAPMAAIAPLLLPSEDDERIDASHRLVWSLFAGEAAAARDFLWHEEKPGSFLVLSRRRPPDRHPFFETEIKEFAPKLHSGERLAFYLRANPTVAYKQDGKPKRGDVVMHAINSLPKGERIALREQALSAGGPAVTWLRRQSEGKGFELSTTQGDVDVAVVRYDPVAIPRPGLRRDHKAVRFTIVDYQGRLIVRDPEGFLAAVLAGFGKAKAFGCGLMLLKRA